MQIETERLLLRKPQLEDAAALLDFFGDPEVMRWIGSEPGGLAVATEHLERWLGRWEANGMGPFVVVLREDGCLLGRVGPLVWNARTWETSSLAEAGDDAEVELGWALARTHWGRGLGRIAAAPVRPGERPAELDLRIVARLGERGRLPRPCVPHERAHTPQKASVLPEHDDEGAHAVRLPAPEPALEVLRRDGEAAGLRADPTHHLGVAEEVQKRRGVLELRLPQEEPLSLDLHRAPS